MQFLEIEHKFLVSDEFDFNSFDKTLKAMNPLRTKYVEVVDTYFVLDGIHGHVYRHRFDEEIQQLSVKSKSKDPEVREEINLDLSGENQIDSVRGFLSVNKIVLEASLNKKVHVYDFLDAEVVYYQASHGDKQVFCVEIEAKNPESIESAVTTIDSYECAIGLSSSSREKKSLFDLLLGDQLS